MAPAPAKKGEDGGAALVTATEVVQKDVFVGIQLVGKAVATRLGGRSLRKEHL